MTRFRIATYNVHKCKGVDWRVSPHRVADVMCELKADIVALQEVRLSQAEGIAARLATRFTFGAARQHAGEPYGNAVFTRLPVVSQKSYDLTASNRERRQCLCVSLELAPAQKLQFFALHLGTSLIERREQARLLVAAARLSQPSPGVPRIVAGDFNEWTSGLATQLLSRHLRSADITVHLKRRHTYPGLLPFLHLDHIYYDPDLYLHVMQLHRSRLALLASDHLPLWADFEMGREILGS